MKNNTVITGPTNRPPHNACPDYRENACPLLIAKSEIPGYNGEINHATCTDHETAFSASIRCVVTSGRNRVERSIFNASIMILKTAAARRGGESRQCQTVRRRRRPNLDSESEI